MDPMKLFKLEQIRKIRNLKNSNQNKIQDSESSDLDSSGGIKQKIFGLLLYLANILLIYQFTPYMVYTIKKFPYIRPKNDSNVKEISIQIPTFL